MKTASIVAIAALMLCGVNTDAAAIYWSAWDGTISRADFDGSGRQAPVTGLSNPNGIALDLAAGKMYWTDVATNKLQRANLNGSGLTDVITTGLYQPRGMTLDVAQGKMYWINGGTDSGQPIKIERANLDGTGRQTLISRSYASGALFDIALDITHSKMYFTDYISNKIERANLDGTGVEDVISSGLNDPWGIALDVSNSEMYWADAGTVFRAKMDGTARETLFTRGSEGLSGIALDLPAGKMYWVNGADAMIQRANLNGTSVENLITGSQYSKFVTLDTTPEPSSLLIAAGCSMLLLRRTRPRRSWRSALLG